MSVVPVPIVWFLVWILAATVAFIVECIVYFFFVVCYYRFGPALRQQVWRCDAGLPSAEKTLQKAIESQHLVWRRKTRGQAIFYLARKPASKFSMWPRNVFRVEEDASSGHAVITAEVRVFLSLLLFVPPWFFVPRFTLLAGGCIIVLIVAGYVFFWVWELRLPELRQIRADLASIGVRVCEQCGYDIRSTPNRCPECGHSASTAA